MAIDLSRAHLVARIEHLENTQWWPPDVLADYQRGLLRPLLEHACSTVPYYQEVFDELQVTPEAVAADRWTELPILTRRDVQFAGPALHSSDVPGEHGPTTVRLTGGSTGTPVEVVSTQRSGKHGHALAIRNHLWHRHDFSQTVAVIRYTKGTTAAPPGGALLPNWSSGTWGHIDTGPCAVLSVRSTTREQAEWLQRVRPAYVMTYPSLVEALALHALREPFPLPGLRQVWTFGEVLDPTVRRLCREAWDVDVVDAYSAEEVGAIALQCPVSGDYHVQSEDLLVEILDEEGRPCGEGEFGRVVITPLHNYAMPLLRYEIGDYAEVGGRCSCGRGLPVLRRILGRQRNMFLLPNGESRWPAFELDPSQVFDGQVPILQFQVTQTSRTELEVKLVAFRHLKSTEGSALSGMVEAWLGYPFILKFTYVDDIPRSPTGKFEDFRRDFGA